MSEPQRQVSYFAFRLGSLVSWTTRNDTLWRVVTVRTTYRWMRPPQIEYGVALPDADGSLSHWVSPEELRPSTQDQEETLRG